MSVRYVTDESGERVAVLLDIEEYERMVEELEELEDIRAYDEAIAELERGEDEAIPWEQVREEIASKYEEPEAARRPRGRDQA